MIANLSSDISHYEETLTTCRFSTRCAKLENLVKQNVKVNLKELSKKLKFENNELKEELRHYREKFGKIDGSNNL